jgi:hypothetical protein
MVITRRDEDVFIHVEGCGQQLGEDVDDVIVSVGPIVKLDPGSTLPFLGLKNMVSVRRMEDEA